LIHFFMFFTSKLLSMSRGSLESRLGVHWVASGGRHDGGGVVMREALARLRAQKPKRVPRSLVRMPLVVRNGPGNPALLPPFGGVGMGAAGAALVIGIGFRCAGRNYPYARGKTSPLFGACSRGYRPVPGPTSGALLGHHSGLGGSA
jgi:hypothetical protein